MDLANADSESRKNTPIFSGLLMYFPDACAAVSRLSFQANEKHNPGEPMHWSKDKSADHADCVVRHLMTPRELDEFGEYHAVAAAWRALANLQTIYDEDQGAVEEIIELIKSGPVPLPNNEEIGLEIPAKSHRFQIVNPGEMSLMETLEGSQAFCVYDMHRDQWHWQAEGWDFWILPHDIEKGYVEIIW